MSDAKPTAELSGASIDDEISNFLGLYSRIAPHRAGEELGDIEIFGQSRFLNGSAGGDHLIYLDFDRRFDLERRAGRARAEGKPAVAAALLANRDRIGVLLADVSGHKLTDALVTAMLHQAFLTGVLYELDRCGEVSTRLFENLNTRFFKSTSIEKYISLIYGEISRTGAFRFISAGHPPPLVFSAEFDRLVNISDERLIAFYPLGMFPSEVDVDASRNLGALRYKPEYTVNEVNLMGTGDLLLLATDGLTEHEHNEEPFFPHHLEAVLRKCKSESARFIQEAIVAAMADFAEPEDDTTVVVIKRRG